MGQLMRKLLVSLAVLLVVGGIVAYFFWPFGGRSQLFRLPGVVEIQEIRLGSKIGGRVKEVFVVEGDIVEKDRLLVQFDMPEMEAQYAQMAARLQAMEAELEKAKNGPRAAEREAGRQASRSAEARWERLMEGPRPEEIKQAKSEYETADADLKLANEDFERIDRLYRQNAGSRAEWDAARATRSRSEGRVASAKARLALLLAGPRVKDIKKPH